MKTTLFTNVVYFASLILFIFIPQTLLGQKTYTLENCVNEFSKDKAVTTGAGYQYWFADETFLSDGRTLKLSVVEKGKASHAPHKHVEDEFLFVLEGTAEFYLDGKTKVVGPLTSLYCPSNVEHGIKNAGDTQLKYLVIRKYEGRK
jgi:quercetin dioxygenase-like cupin family protein